jgi:hypothetical protein
MITVALTIPNKRTLSWSLALARISWDLLNSCGSFDTELLLEDVAERVFCVLEYTCTLE